jgi:hypothetical protein
MGALVDLGEPMLDRSRDPGACDGCDGSRKGERRERPAETESASRMARAVSIMAHPG